MLAYFSSFCRAFYQSKQGIAAVLRIVTPAKVFADLRFALVVATTVGSTIKLMAAPLDPNAPLIAPTGTTTDLGGQTQTVTYLNLEGGTVQNGTLLTTSPFGFSVQSGAVSASLAGQGSLEKGTAGTVVLSGINSYSGFTIVQEGTLAITGAGTLGSSSPLVLGGGTVDLGGTTQTIGYLSQTGGLIQNGTLNAAYFATQSGTISATLAGSGYLSENNGTIVLSGINTYTGPTHIATMFNSAGTVALSGAGSIASSSGVVNYGTLDISATNAGASIQALSGTGQVALGAKTLTITAATFTNFSGTITGTGGFALTGGTQILSGANTYAGGTTIAGGTLQIGAGGTSGSIVGGVVNNGVLAFDRSDVSTFAGAISGTGALQQIGSGTTILSGTNTYSGGTTISTGTLSVSMDANLGAASGGLTFSGGTLATTANMTTARNATLNSTGPVAQPGVAFAGSNLGSGTFAPAAGTVLTYGGSIGGAGALTLTGLGTVKLTGSDLYIGATSVNTGQLEVGQGGAIGASSSLINSGTFKVDAGGTATFIGNAYNNPLATLTTNGTLNIGGTFVNYGSVTVNASGAINTRYINNLSSGTSNVVGPLNFGASTIQISAAGNAGGTISVGAATISAASIDNFGGTLTSTGTITTTRGLLNQGTVTVSGALNSNVTNAGAFDIVGSLTGLASFTQQAGTLDLGGNTIALTRLNLVQGTVQNGTLVATNGYNVRAGFVNASLSGATTLTKTGGGSVALNGVDTYTGATTVESGRLAVNGSIVSSTTVLDGGVLGGSGTVAGVTVEAGGTLSPGTVPAIGRLNSTGPLTFLPGSIYNVRVTPTTSDQTNIAGTATIGGGTVNVLAGSGVYQPQSRYDILTASGGVNGTFSGVTSNLAFLTPTLAYDADDVTLVLNRNDLSFAAVAATQNQNAVANALTRASPIATSAAAGSFLNAVANLSAAQAQAAFDSLSGEGITAAQNLAHRQSELFNSSIFDQIALYGGDSPANSVTLSDAPPALPAGLLGYASLASSPIRLRDPLLTPQRTWRAWGTGFGGAENIGGNAGLGSAGQTSTIYGGTLGIDYQVTPNYLAGIAIGGSEGDFQVNSRSTYGSTTGGHIAFYDLATFGSFYGASSSSFSYFGNTTNRTVAGFGGLGTEVERGNFGSSEIRSRLEFGRHYNVYGGTLTPFIALEVAELRSNGFTESAQSGAGRFALNVSGQSQASLPSFLGARYQGGMRLADGLLFSPTIQMAYVHEFAPERSQIATFAALPGSTFLVDGSRPGRDAAQVKAGGELALSSRSALFVDFDGEFSGQAQAYSGKGGFKYVW
ncbi:MAG: autotransporter domain-containing protein [Beijerinckiaceae bacterium]|nr:autotransporter domain-containing protein [Beijerinckiaceae bacterium]